VYEAYTQKIDAAGGPKQAPGSAPVELLKLLEARGRTATNWAQKLVTDPSSGADDLATAEHRLRGALDDLQNEESRLNPNDPTYEDTRYSINWIRCEAKLNLGIIAKRRGLVAEAEPLFREADELLESIREKGDEGKSQPRFKELEERVKKRLAPK